MNENDMYPVCTILYKTDNSAGWYYAIMSGDKNECSKECEKLKAKYNWYDYKCYVSSSHVKKQNIPFQNYKPSPEYIIRCTDLIYNDDDGKWYYYRETMPYPQKEKRINHKFYIDVKGEGEVDTEYYWLPEPKYKDDFEGDAEVLIDFGLKYAKIYTTADDNIEYVKNFISRLIKDKYSNLSFDPYSTSSILLAWENGDNVRFIIKDYYEYSDGVDAISVFDRLIPKNLFYNEFQSLIEKLEFYINKHKEVRRKFHEQEKLLNSLRWEYDEDLPYVPWEYSIIKWNKGKTKELEEFADMIYKSAEPNVILDDEPNECFTCRLIGDYYYAVSEKDNGTCICRTYFLPHKLKNILRFMKSKDFEYKKGMSLTEIYNQLLNKGYHQAIECKYKDKEVLIYANGQVDSQEATKEETEELEQIIKKLAKNINEKENLTVSKFVDILKDHITSISYRDNKMVL